MQIQCLSSRSLDPTCIISNYISRVKIFCKYGIYTYTVCPSSSYPPYVVSYYMKWVQLLLGIQYQSAGTCKLAESLLSVPILSINGTKMASFVSNYRSYPYMIFNNSVSVLPGFSYIIILTPGSGTLVKIRAKLGSVIFQPKTIDPLLSNPYQGQKLDPDSDPQYSNILELGPNKD